MLQEEVNLENLKWLKIIDGAYKQFVDGAVTANECALRLLWYDGRDLYAEVKVVHVTIEDIPK